MAESNELEFLRETTRRYIRTRAPISAVRKLFDDDRGYEVDYWLGAAELGWSSFLGDVEASRDDFADSLTALVVVAEEMGRAVAPGPLSPVTVVSAALSRSGSFLDRDAVLNELSAGEKTAAWCVAERGTGWLDLRQSLTITRDGEHWVINGRKDFVEAGSTADYLLVSGQSDDGVIQILVPSTAAGISVSRLKSLDFTRRFASIGFANCRVPFESLVSSPEVARVDIEHQRALALIIQCAESVGAMSEVLDRTIEYAQERVAFGRTISSYQAIKHYLAKAKVDLEASRGAVMAASVAVGNGAENAEELISIMKSFVAVAADHLIQICIQIDGAIGVTWEHDVHIYLRRVTVNRSPYGSPEEHHRRLGKMSMKTYEYAGAK